MFSTAGNYTLRENAGCDGRKLVLCMTNVAVLVRQTQLDDLHGLWFMVFNATFNTIIVISWLSVLLVEETRIPGENHRPVASNWRTLSHVVSSTSRYERTSNS